MTTLSSRPSPVSPYTRHTKTSTRQSLTPPVAFTSSPIRRTRSDSPSPTMLHPRAAATYPNSENEEDEDFPPSISQRRVPARPKVILKGRDTKLLLATDSGTRLKEKRSFERTRRWAEEAEESRRVRLEQTDDEDHTEGLVDDRSWDGSTSSPIPPRTPSPISSSSIAPQLSLSISSDTHAPILSIDEIIALHSASAQGAFTAAKDRARRELGLAPSPIASVASSPQAKSRAVTGGVKSGRLSDPPEIPRRISSSPTTPHSIPTRSSSMADSSATVDRSISQQSSPRKSPIRSMTTPRPDPNQSSGTLPPSDHRPSHLSLSQATTNISQSDRPSTPSSNTPTSTSRPRPSKARSSTAPASTAHIEQTHEMALHLRSESLNKFLTFPRPFPDRPLRVSYAEVGKPDGYPVLMFLGVGCVRYLIAMYDQLALVYGLRLICVDRWGYGKTDQVDQVDRGVVEWAGVIGQVVKSLDIGKFQVIGHSAGVPYAMAVARRYPEMIRGRLHLLAPWVGQDHDNVSKWLKWVPGGVIRTATAADHKLQTYFLGKAPRLQYAPISSNPTSTPYSDDEEPPIEELEESTKPTSLIRRASTVFSSRSKPRSRSIYGTSASVSTVNLSLPLSGSEPMRRTGSAGRASMETGGSPSTIGRSPALQNLKNLAGVMSSRNLTFGPTSYDSRGTNSTAPSSNFLATPDKSKMAISPSEVDIGLGEGFGSFNTDLGLVIPTLKAGHPSRGPSDTSVSISRSTSGSGSDRHSLVEMPEYPPTPPTPNRSHTTYQEPTPILPPSRFPSDPIFSMALSQASHAECEPGTTSDILRIVLNKPYRPWGFRYEDVIPRSHVWVGEDDKLISKESVLWMEEVCGATVDRRVGEGHNLLSSPKVLCDLFKCLGEDARTAWRMEEEERDGDQEIREKERAEKLREEGLRKVRRAR